MEVVGGNLTKIFNYAVAVSTLLTLGLIAFLIGYIVFFKPDMDLIINKVFGEW